MVTCQEHVVMHAASALLTEQCSHGRRTHKWLPYKAAVQPTVHRKPPRCRQPCRSPTSALSQCESNPPALAAPLIKPANARRENDVQERARAPTNDRSKLPEPPTAFATALHQAQSSARP